MKKITFGIIGLLLALPVSAITVPVDTGTGYFDGEFTDAENTRLVNENWFVLYEQKPDGSIVGTDNLPNDFEGFTGGINARINGLPFGEAYINEGGDSSYHWGIWFDDTFADETNTNPNIIDGFQQRDFRWSTNNLSFTGKEFNEQAKGETFVAGILNYTNGGSALGASPDSVMFELISFGDSNDFIQSLMLEITIDTSPNTGTEEENADYIYFTDFQEFGSFRVLEEQTGTVEILAEFNSLHLMGFGNVLTPNVAFTNTSVVDALAVPEPATLALLSLGLAGIRFSRKKKSA